MHRLAQHQSLGVAHYACVLLLHHTAHIHKDVHNRLGGLDLFGIAIGIRLRQLRKIYDRDVCRAARGRIRQDFPDGFTDGAGECLSQHFRKGGITAVLIEIEETAL